MAMNTHYKTRLFVPVLGLAAFLATISLSQSAFADDWAQWRGPKRTGHAAADAFVPDRLPSSFNPLWRKPIGGGFGSPVVAGNVLVYTDEADGKEIAYALDVRTGNELWKNPFADVFEDNWGKGPRSTPYVDGDRVYVQACNGAFRCLSIKDGTVLWQADFEKDFGVKFLGSKSNEGTASRRGNSANGVIADNRLILPVGGKNECSLVCFDKVTGKVQWKCGNDEAAYSSLVVGTLAGVPQVVAFTAEALMGAELETGKILWRIPLKTNAKRHAATPVIMGDTVVVSSQTIGLCAFRIKKDGGTWSVETAWANKQLRINVASEVLVGDFLYSMGANKDFVCVEFATGRLRWSQPGFGRGEKDNASLIVTGKKIMALTEPGELILMDANPEKYTELGRLQICGSNWSYPAYANGRLYFRDNRELCCLDLSGGQVK